MERAPFPLSDEEFVDRCMEGIKIYYNSVKDMAPFNVDECVRYVCDKYYKVVYKNARGYWSRNEPLRREDTEELTALYIRVEAMLRKQAQEAAIAKASMLKARKISKVTATAAIMAVFQENGYNPEIYAQCYRAKISLAVAGKYTVTMTIPYKAVTNGKLDECVQDFKNMVKCLENSNYEFLVRKN